MAIAFDAVAGAKDSSGAVTSLTFSHTCTGSNRLLIVSGSVTSLTARTITGVTYAGTSMTFVITATASQVVSFMYILVNPTTGANNVVVTISGVTDGLNKQFNAISSSYTGCAQSGQPDSHGTNVLNGSTVTNFPVSTTVVASNCWLVGTASEDAGDIAAGAAGTGTTYRGVAEFNQIIADSNGTVGTGSQTLNWGRAGSTGNISGIVISISAFGTTAATGAFLLKLL